MPDPKLDLEQQVCMSLGRVVIAFNSLERQIANIACALLGGDANIGEIIACNSPYSALVRLMEALFREKVKEEDLIAQMTQLIKDAAQAAEKRNILMHSFWLIDEHGPIPSTREKSRLVLGKGLRKSFEWVDVEEISALADHIHHTSYNFLELLNELEKRKIAFGPGYLPPEIEAML